MLLQVDAVYAVSWTWPSDAPVVGHGEPGPSGAKDTAIALTPLSTIRPAIRWRTAVRGMPSATLFRCVIMCLRVVGVVTMLPMRPRFLYSVATNPWRSEASSDSASCSAGFAVECFCVAPFSRLLKLCEHARLFVEIFHRALLFGFLRLRRCGFSCGWLWKRLARLPHARCLSSLETACVLAA